MKTRNVAILIFDDVEILDFAGPYEVFAVTRQFETPQPFNVYTVAEKAGPISARNGLSVNAAYAIDDCPTPDVIVVPGGRGRANRSKARGSSVDSPHAQTAEQVLSVCRGRFCSAAPGCRRLAATTSTAFDVLRQVAPNTEQRPGERWVDNGKIVTSAGVSAGIDAALHVVGSSARTGRRDGGYIGASTGGCHAPRSRACHGHVVGGLGSQGVPPVKESLTGTGPWWRQTERIVAASLTRAWFNAHIVGEALSAPSQAIAHVYFDATHHEDTRHCAGVRSDLPRHRRSLA